MTIVMVMMMMVMTMINDTMHRAMMIDNDL